MLADKRICSGCGLCEFICSVGAIKMIQDEEGFFYPQIDKDKCVECGRCQAMCPSLNGNNMQKEVTEEKVYAGYHKELSTLLKSSSGGAAYTIAKEFILQGGVVFGVSYTSDYRGAEYIMVNDIDKLSVLRESKYVESTRRNMYVNIKPLIEQGIKVLVIGLPCDIAAIKMFIGDSENLYTIKLCCRSNTSTKVLREFVDNLEKEFSSSISRLSLRYKEKDTPRFPTKCRADFVDGQVFISDFTKTDYGKAFQIMARPSCLNCKSKEIQGLADMTLGDFQGANPTMDYYNTNGLSLIVEHSEKGRQLRKMLSNFFLKKMPYEDVMAYNWMAYSSIPKSEIRDQFSKNFVEVGLKKTCSDLIREQNEQIDIIVKKMVQEQPVVAMWGVGDTAETLYDRFRLKEWNLQYVFDSSKLKIGTEFKGMKVNSLAELSKFARNIDILIVMIPSESEEKLNNILHEIGWIKPVIHTGKYKFYRG